MLLSFTTLAPVVSGKKFANERRRNCPPACTLPMKNTYYHVGSTDEIGTILCDGFVNNMKAVKQRGGRDWRGICIDDSPTKPNPVYPDIKHLDRCCIYVADASGGPDWIASSMSRNRSLPRSPSSLSALVGLSMLKFKVNSNPLGYLK
jgi:hypothetical protein